MGKLLLGLAFVLTVLCASAQNKDTAKAAPAPQAKDTTKKKKLSFKERYAYPNSTVAMVCSAVIPGLGQAYNKKYWKIPIVYAGLGTLGYFIVTNQQQYNIYIHALNHSNDPLNQIYSPSDLVARETYFARYRNISIIGAAFVYLLNIIDANVDAQLQKFDVSDNISFHFSPIMSPIPTAGFNFQPGVSFAFKF